MKSQGFSEEQPEPSALPTTATSPAPFPDLTSLRVWRSHLGGKETALKKLRRELQGRSYCCPDSGEGNVELTSIPPTDFPLLSNTCIIFFVIWILCILIRIFFSPFFPPPVLNVAAAEHHPLIPMVSHHSFNPLFLLALFLHFLAFSALQAGMPSCMHICLLFKSTPFLQNFFLPC